MNFVRRTVTLNSIIYICWKRYQRNRTLIACCRNSVSWTEYAATQRARHRCPYLDSSVSSVLVYSALLTSCPKFTVVETPFAVKLVAHRSFQLYLKLRKSTRPNGPTFRRNSTRKFGTSLLNELVIKKNQNNIMINEVLFFIYLFVISQVSICLLHTLGNTIRWCSI